MDSHFTTARRYADVRAKMALAGRARPAPSTNGLKSAAFHRRSLDATLPLVGEPAAGAWLLRHHLPGQRLLYPADSDHAGTSRYGSHQDPSPSSPRHRGQEETGAAQCPKVSPSSTSTFRDSETAKEPGPRPPALGPARLGRLRVVAATTAGSEHGSRQPEHQGDDSDVPQPTHRQQQQQ